LFNQLRDILMQNQSLLCNFAPVLSKRFLRNQAKAHSFLFFLVLMVPWG